MKDLRVGLRHKKGFTIRPDFYFGSVVAISALHRRMHNMLRELIEKAAILLLNSIGFKIEYENFFPEAFSAADRDCETDLEKADEQFRRECIESILRRPSQREEDMRGCVFIDRSSETLSLITYCTACVLTETLILSPLHITMKEIGLTISGEENFHLFHENGEPKKCDNCGQVVKDCKTAESLRTLGELNDIWIGEGDEFEVEDSMKEAMQEFDNINRMKIIPFDTPWFESISKERKERREGWMEGD